ncbi:MAG: hypothetical protein HZC02_00735 [Candidatus Levybacteria bacterium]|nr:hypothetical protein [Candidatus Levybacteria bacterium]
MLEPNEFIRQLDHLFDDDPVNIHLIDGVLMTLTRGAMQATLEQRIEGLIPYMAGVNFILNEIGWRCEENPTNGTLHYIKGRLTQLIDMIDAADDTSLSERVIDTVIATPLYLKVLQGLEARSGRTIWIGGLAENKAELDSIMNWMEPHQLIEVTNFIASFGPKGQRTLEAVLEKMGDQQSN